jgi:hypothetical protein
MKRSIYFVQAALLGLLMLGLVEGVSGANAAQIDRSATVAPPSVNGVTNSDVVQVRERVRRYKHHGRPGYRYRRPHYRTYPYFEFYGGPFYYYYDYPYDGYYSGRCGYWSRQCARNWGYGTHNYYGCLRYHRCY